jgi:hypothetical protein
MNKLFRTIVVETSGIRTIAGGGTGASTASAALINLGALPVVGGTLAGNLTVNGTVSASSTIFSADRQVVTTNTTTVAGTSAVTSIIAVSVLPDPQETGVLYIVI